MKGVTESTVRVFPWLGFFLNHKVTPQYPAVTKVLLNNGQEMNLLVAKSKVQIEATGQIFTGKLRITRDGYVHFHGRDRNGLNFELDTYLGHARGYFTDHTYESYAFKQI